MRLGGTDKHRTAIFENNKIVGEKAQTTTLYQKYAMIKLLLDNDVTMIHFQPETYKIVVPITKNTFDWVEYIPDFLVVIKGKKYVIETRAKEVIKENIEHYRAVMKEMRKQSFIFKLWEWDAKEEEIVDITKLLIKTRKKRKTRKKKK